MLNQIINLPKLRFGEFEGEYKEHLFHDIFLFSTGKNIKQKEASPEFETPCIRYGELYHMYNEVVYKIINRTNLDKSELLFSQGNEILLPSAGEDPLDIGSASALTLKNIAIGRTINILRPKDKNIYSQKYVSYYINEKLKRKISTLAKGSSISNVYNSDLKKLKIILPTLDEQQKIDEFLTSIDKKIEQLNQKRTLLESYKKGVMQKIFSQEIRFKRDDGGVFEDRKKYELKNILEISSNKFNPKKYNIKKKCIELEHLSQNRGQLLGYTFTNKQGSIKNIFNKNEVLFGKLRPYLKKYWKSTFEGVCSSEIWVLKGKKIINEYLFYLIQDDKFNQIANISSGSKMPRSDWKYMAEIPFLIPQKQEQQKISNFLTSIDQKITQNNQSIEQMKAFKKGLLQQMFV